MYLAVAGDVHGHLALLYAILGRWQRESGRSFDLILQVGDLGAFASGSELDRATQRHARTDPEEMGFRDFARPEPPRTLLDPRPPLVFIPGNHEDFDFLARHEARAGASPVYPITPDGKIQALRSGRLREPDARLLVAISLEHDTLRRQAEREGIAYAAMNERWRRARNRLRLAVAA